MATMFMLALAALVYGAVIVSLPELVPEEEEVVFQFGICSFLYRTAEFYAIHV
jgi:hypothetical protein